MHHMIYFNPCAAELFVSIFHSFAAGIANAISSFKWMKNIIIYEKWECPKLNYLTDWASTRRYVAIFVVFYLVWN